MILSEYDRVISRDVVRFHVWVPKIESVQEKLEGTVDNKAGYGTPETAQRLGQMYQEMLRQGYTEQFEHDNYAHGYGSIWLRWVEYTGLWGDKGYTGATFEPGGDGRFSTFKRASKLLDRLASLIVSDATRRSKAFGRGYYRDEPGDWCFERPSVVANALDRAGAVRVKHWRDPNDPRDWSPAQVVRDSARRMRFREEDVLTLLEAS
jgi:hypothetical protein